MAFLGSSFLTKLTRYFHAKTLRLRAKFHARFLSRKTINNRRIATLRFKVADKVIPFSYRPDSIGDDGVIRQIFMDEDYSIDQWPQGKAILRYYQSLLENRKIPLIIDAGANIGASAAYFSIHYPEGKIIAVEPAPNNCALLRINTHGRNVEIVEGAVGGENETLFLNDSRKDWDFQVSREGGLPVAARTVDSLLAKYPDAIPFIAKVDIEGGEKNLFSCNTGWMNGFPLIVIELHDWMLPGQRSSKPFITALAGLDFELIHKGENLFCFNASILYGNKKIQDIG